MRYFIESTVDGRDYDALLDRYPFLKEFGYEPIEVVVHCKKCDRHELRPSVNVEGLDQLMGLVGRFGMGGLIVFPDTDVYNGVKNKWEKLNIPGIEIYDGYRE